MYKARRQISLKAVKTEFMRSGTPLRVEHLSIAPDTTPYALFVNDNLSVSNR